MNQKSERMPSRTAEEKRRRRERIIIFICAVLIVLMTSLMVYISGSSTFVSLASNILVYGLINFNVILLLLLIFLVVRNVIKLIFERKRRIFGSKLRTRLVVAFVGFSIIPTILLFVAAISYITKSTEMWLSSQIEQSLHESLKVAQLYYQNSANNAIFFARQISRMITEKGLLKKEKKKVLLNLLREKQKEYNLSSIEIYSPDQVEMGKVVSPQLPKESLVRPEYQLLLEGFKGKELSNIQSLGAGDLIRGVVPVYSSWNAKDIAGVVFVGFFMQRSLIGKMNKISKTFEEYRYLKTRKAPIKLNYLIYLTLIALLIIFSATWFGFYLAKQITVPIQALAEKTKDVAHGHLDVRIDQVSSDEIGTLVESFNRMAHDIKTSKEELERSNIDLQRANFESEQRRRYMEIVLRNVTAGVISIDKDSRITTINKSAERMLGIKTHKVLNKKYPEVLQSEHYVLVTAITREMEDVKKESLERQITLKLGDEFRTILVNFTVLRDEKDDYMGMVVVFDDLTELQKAQRMTAWKEVARRIAHEIKNPLTPIQLSAQRLRRKYLTQFKEDGAIFEECTSTIVDQVDTMRKLVNEFQNFARMPASNPVPNDINEIIEEVLTLYLGNHGKVFFEAGSAIPTLALDTEQVKRAMINLIDNSLAAMDEREGEIHIKTSFSKKLKLVRIEIADDGHGIPPEDKAKLFEPYFSRKKTGTGLGLTIVNTIITDHNGYIRVFDNKPKGTKFIIELPV